MDRQKKYEVLWTFYHTVLAVELLIADVLLVFLILGNG